MTATTAIAALLDRRQLAAELVEDLALELERYPAPRTRARLNAAVGVVNAIDGMIERHRCSELGAAANRRAIAP
jgi:hypothetical protein